MSLGSAIRAFNFLAKVVFLDAFLRGKEGDSPIIKDGPHDVLARAICKSLIIYTLVINTYVHNIF